MNWHKVEHNGNTGFGGHIVTIADKQGRVYPITPTLWRWEVRELNPRKLINTGTAYTEEEAKSKVHLDG